MQNFLEERAEINLRSPEHAKRPRGTCTNTERSHRDSNGGLVKDIVEEKRKEEEEEEEKCGFMVWLRLFGINLRHMDRSRGG
jgi:hypothetical protein